MLKLQEDKRSMYIVVKDVCNRNKGIWINFKGFVEAFGEFEMNLTEIGVQSQIQGENITGIATDKRKISEEMIQMSIEVSGAVYAFASKARDNELMKRVNYNYRDLKRFRDTILKDNCQIIHDEANKIIAQLADYGKTPADLAMLQDIINNYVVILEKPRVAKTITKVATAKLKEHFIIEDNILRTRLDKLMEKYKTTEPKFYYEYKSARIIINTASHTISLKVTVKDTDGNGIAKVSAKITNIPKNPNSKEVINEISKKTTTKGAFKIASLAEGNYKATFSKPGFESQIINFSVASGETTKLNLIMIN